MRAQVQKRFLLQIEGKTFPYPRSLFKISFSLLIVPLYVRNEEIAYDVFMLPMILTFYSAYVRWDVTWLLKKLEKEEYKVEEPGEILSEMKHLEVHMSDRTAYNISFKLPFS